MLLVHVSIIDRKCNSLLAESACSSDPMQVGLRISANSAVDLLLWHVVVDDELDLWHVDTSGNQVGSDQHIDLLLSELLDGAVSLLFRHLGEHNVGRVPGLSQPSVDLLSEVQAVDEDEGLGHLTALEDVFDEVQLLLWLASHSVLLDMVKLELLGFDLDLLCLLDDHGDSLLDLLVDLLSAFRVGCGEKDPLDLVTLLSLFDVFVVADVFQTLEVLLVEEEHIRLINDKTFQAK